MTKSSFQAAKDAYNAAIAKLSAAEKALSTAQALVTKTDRALRMEMETEYR